MAAAGALVAAAAGGYGAAASSNFSDYVNVGAIYLVTLVWLYLLHVSSGSGEFFHGCACAGKNVRLVSFANGGMFFAPFCLFSGHRFRDRRRPIAFRVTGFSPGDGRFLFPRSILSSEWPILVQRLKSTAPDLVASTMRWAPWQA
ncbi:hypothetical protein BS78_06G021900 [Paspalum vaginatum]|nr:hypothetical protein BS78_06G021900 [Paspalum vaginatum]